MRPGSPLLRRLDALVLALWWGGLTVVTMGVVPLLFRVLTPPALAGEVAAQLFSALNGLGLGCGLSLLFLYRKNALAHVNTAQTAIFYVAFCMLVALLLEFAVAPRIVARDNLRLWHGVGSGLYLVQWLTLAWLVWRRAESGASKGPAA